MDAERFDRWSRAVASPARRAAIGALGAAALGLTGALGRSGDARAGSAPGRTGKPRLSTSAPRFEERVRSGGPSAAGKSISKKRCNCYQDGAFAYGQVDVFCFYNTPDAETEEACQDEGLDCAVLAALCDRDAAGACLDDFIDRWSAA